MNIVLLDPLAVSYEVLEELSKGLIEMGHSFKSYDTVEKNKEILMERVRDAEVLIIANNPLTGDVIRAAEKLK